MPSTSSTVTAPTPSYAVEVVRTAAAAGADVVVLCDTNGGMLPNRLADVVAEVLGASDARLGIHCHNDTACAVANTLAAVDAGVTHVQGCANGYGERAGNADLFSVIADLEIKMGRSVLPQGHIGELLRVSHAIDEVANLTPHPHRPYVGVSAFAHKAGLHASAIKVDPTLYQHIDPALVGNDMRMLVSELAGRATVELKSRELGLDVATDRVTTGRVVDRIKDLEARGFVFEAAEASFELLLREEVEGLPRFYDLESWRVIVERRSSDEVVSEATVKLRSRGERIVATAEGNGPVNALDRALRQALEKTYPGLADLELVDYKVRILEGKQGTAAVTECWSRRATATPNGRPSASTRTSSRLRGAHWRMRSPTASCARTRFRTRAEPLVGRVRSGCSIEHQPTECSDSPTRSSVNAAAGLPRRSLSYGRSASSAGTTGASRPPAWSRLLGKLWKKGQHPSACGRPAAALALPA